MNLLRFFISIITLFFIPSTVFASTIWHPEESPSVRRNNYSLTKEQYEKFDQARKHYYKELLGDLSAPQEIPFFEITHPISRQKIFMLGTFHDLPFESLPTWFYSFIETQVNEIYLESEWVTRLALMGKNSNGLASIDLTLGKENFTFLTPLLNIFSQTEVPLRLEEFYIITMGFDCFLGMDATIELLSLKMNKPLFMLDNKIDLLSSNLGLHRKMLEQRLDATTDIEKKTHLESLLKGSDEHLMLTYIKEELPALSHHYSNKAVFGQNLNEWSREPNVDSNNLDNENFTDAEVLERNARWIELLNSTSPSRKLVAVGAGHLLDLFERFKKLGYEIKRYQPD